LYTGIVKTRNLPIGIQGFECLRKSGFIYIGRTAGLYRIPQASPASWGRRFRIGAACNTSARKLGEVTIQEG
jgi:UDP-3-O-[3-hydroxymyristoyl] glucosamine N-acyltransferase